MLVIDSMGREMQTSRRHAERCEISTIGRADVGDRGKLPIKRPQQNALGKRRPRLTQQVRITAKNQRQPVPPAPGDDPQMRGVVITEEQDDIRPPGGQAPWERGVRSPQKWSVPGRRAPSGTNSDS